MGTYTARTAPFMPGASPPEVRTPILLFFPGKGAGGISALVMVFALAAQVASWQEGEGVIYGRVGVVGGLGEIRVGVRNERWVCWIEGLCEEGQSKFKKSGRHGGACGRCGEVLSRAVRADLSKSLSTRQALVLSMGEEDPWTEGG